jgi:hypothetical protein
MIWIKARPRNVTDIAHESEIVCVHKGASQFFENQPQWRAVELTLELIPGCFLPTELPP